MTDYTELQIMALSELASDSTTCFITLVDKELKRQLSLVCDRTMKNMLQLRMSRSKERNIMLPEVMCRILRRHTEDEYVLVINDIVDGIYRATIINSETKEMNPIKAVDAVLLHIVSHFPLYATNQLMSRQAVPFVVGPSVAIPYNALSDNMLTDAFNRAVKKEEYEVASVLRDELKKRGIDTANVQS